MADRTPLPTTGAAAPYAFHAHANGEVWTWAAAVSIAAELRRELIQHPRARLLLSGGGTPGPVYRALSQAPLDWDRVDVGLVDERWLLPDDPDSNAHLVHETPHGVLLLGNVFGGIHGNQLILIDNLVVLRQDP